MGPSSTLTLRLGVSHVFVDSILIVVYCCIKINLLANLRYASVDIHIENIDNLPSKQIAYGWSQGGTHIHDSFKISK